MLLAAFAGPAMQAWSAFDRLLAPEWARTFFWWRFGFLSLTVALLIAVRRARTLFQVRSYVAAIYLAAAVVIAPMLPRVAQHHEMYVLGFSICFWIIGVLSSWPARFTVGVLLGDCGIFALAHLTYRGPRTMKEIIGTMFFIGTATAFSIVACALRQRLERGAFDASRALEEKNHALSEAEARLVASEKLSALGRLLSGVSHEINNPINVIHNNLGPLRDYNEAFVALLAQARAEAKAGGRFEARWQELDGDFITRDSGAALGAVATATQRLHSVHADLRAFIRGDAPTAILGDLNEGLRTTAAMVQRSLGARVKLKLALAELPPTTFQPGQLNQVWLNLLQNAIDAVAAEGEISVESRVADGAIEVEVRDTGPGIDPSVRDRLFEPFVTTKGVGTGTGLGLALSYQIVKNHQGNITASDAPGRGARFVVWLPVTGKAERAERSGAAA